jgi:hypothetical protein
MILLMHHDGRSAAIRRAIRSVLTIGLIMAALAGIVALKTGIYLGRLTSARLPVAVLIDSARTKVATAIADEGRAKAGDKAGDKAGKKYG